MKLVFAERAWEDYLHWREADRKLLERINALIEETARTPFEGTGKPEPLKHALAGYWSRCIADEHRFVYKIDGDSLHPAKAGCSSRCSTNSRMRVNCGIRT